MAYTIRSSDGRLRICTFGAAMAVVHVKRLRALGLRVRVTDFNGHNYRPFDLERRAAEADA